MGYLDPLAAYRDPVFPYGHHRSLHRMEACVRAAAIGAGHGAAGGVSCVQPLQCHVLKLLLRRHPQQATVRNLGSGGACARPPMSNALVAVLKRVQVKQTHG